MTKSEAFQTTESRWDWPKYQASLVGPLPHILRPSGCYVPDYSHPGVADRVRVEVDYIEDMERRT